MAKDCGKHGNDHLFRSAIACIVFLVIVVLLIVLIVFLVLRPHKPKFYLQDATVLSFNLSSPNLLSTYLQVTVSSKNPNNRVGVYYDRLDVYASYMNQQITLPSPIVPHYQGHNDVDVWSPYLRGDAVPIAPFLAAALSQDESDGYFFLWIKIDGKLRWKVGSWRSGHYHLFVNCPAYLSFDRSRSSNPSIRFQRIATCSVDI
ncbi:NDR1/HIN1-like protein 1 [Iris pallida]|uniref:NDR1/HIN1-like protein 1 n=1 Tax=Iris pallida TaxID=29817 RepID=A0AAX6ILY1_IRIPA|nr:NDR1/HIN1-like protein 1 [Iris pallida]